MKLIKNACALALTIGFYTLNMVAHAQACEGCSAVSKQDAAPLELVWERENAPVGRTQSYLSGTEQVFIPFPGIRNTRKPSYNNAHIVPLADGAYVIAPINAGVYSRNLMNIVTPFWESNRGWKVLRVAANGQVLWSRHIRTPAPEAVTPFIEPWNYPRNFEQTLQQSKATADGGLALIISNTTYSYSAEGLLRWQSGYSNACSIGLIETYYDVVNISDDDHFVVQKNAQGVNPPRACAFDLVGNEVMRVNGSRNTLYVLDFRRDFGFLTHDADFSMGRLSNSVLSLRTNSALRWQTNVLAATQFGRQISPTGAVWTTLFTMDNYPLHHIGGTGQILWTQPSAPSRVMAWLNGGDALLGDLATFARVSTAGIIRWQTTLAEPLVGTDFEADIAWQLQNDYVRLSGVDAYNFNAVGRAARIALADGAVSQSIVLPARIGLAPMAAEQLLVLEQQPSDVVRKPSAPCFIAEFCPQVMEFSEAVLKRIDQASGLAAGADISEGLDYPYSSLPLERNSFPQLNNFRQSIVTLRYEYDGVRSTMLLEDIQSNGRQNWATKLAFEFDAINASVSARGDAYFVAAEQTGPLGASASAKMWRVNANTGLVEWVVELPFAIQHLSNISRIGGSDRCGLSRKAPYRAVCVSESGQLVSNLPVNCTIPTGHELFSESRVGNQLRARLVRTGTQSASQFEWRFISPATGNCSERVWALAAPVNTVLRTHGRFGNLVIAGVYPNASSGRAQALAVAKFDEQGNRIWQTLIETPQRFLGDDRNAIAATTVYSTINGSQDFHVVSSHPASTDGSFPTEACRISDAGQLLGCHTSPRQERITSLVEVFQSESNSSRVLALQGGALYELTATGLVATGIESNSHRAFRFDVINSDGKNLYLMLGHGNTRNSTQLRAVRFLEEGLFADGFE